MISFDEYVSEVQRAILLIADHIAWLRDDNAAAAFAGFETASSYADEDPAKVDLRAFTSGGRLLLMYDFAVGSGELLPSDDFEETALQSLISLIPRTDALGAPIAWPDDPAVVRVLDLFRARRKLDEPQLRDEATFTVRELALLADMTEGAVRNALSNGELASRRSGGKVVVGWQDAAIWLPKKRGYRPTTAKVLELDARISAARSLNELVAELAGLPGAQEKVPPEWLIRGWSGDLADAHAVALALNIDPGKLLPQLALLWAKGRSVADRPA